MLEMMSEPGFWVSVAQIIAIDILLGGDNAVVIALACRGLPPAQRTQGILWGVVGAIALRILLIFFAVELLTLPFLKIVGGLLLLWIGTKLLLPQSDGHGDVKASTTLLGAVRTVIIADAVMSIDNVVAVASAAHGHMALVVFGIAVSVPIIVWGSRLVLMLMDRFPVVITCGAALLGWIGGGMWVSDAGVEKQFGALPSTVHYISGAIGAIVVVVTGRWLASRAQAAT
jgi:YjbE family integral membrane protein